MMFENAVTPPQIVPYDSYDNFNDNFDLSILTADNPYSSTTFGSTTAVANALPIITTTPPATEHLEDPSRIIPTIKVENSLSPCPQPWDSYGNMFNTNSAFANQLHVTVPQYGGVGNNSVFHSYPSPHSQASNSSLTSYENQFSAFPPSPTPSMNGYQQQFKQEPICGNLLLPPSPPDSNGAPSPQLVYADPIKLEPQQSVDCNSVPLEECVDIEDYFRGIRPEAENMFRPIDVAAATTSNNGSGDVKDHQLLREFLQDTSFQRKHNLKPVALESLFGGWESRGDIEPVISMAMEQARRDVEDTCAALNISPDPLQWTNAVVQLWLQTMIEQLNLTPLATSIGVAFPENGSQFYNLTEKEFVQKAPQIGSILFAQLEIWKAACIEVPFVHGTDSVVGGQSPNSTTTSLDTEPSDDEEEIEKPEPIPGATKRHGGSHIHLWQFLRELLGDPQTHGAAIRWLDRSKGIFKIEDSVIVARLWGRRKNRPAMNYDKLSRSIRQYYRKGIMKKTERSTRLVYQFCAPYCL